MEQELKDFGLSDNEVKVYLTLLKNKGIGPTELAKQTGFARPYIYDVLQRLQEKGVASTVVNNQKRLYHATSPKQLVELGQQRLEALQKITHKLEALRSINPQTTQVELQTGKFVFRTLLNDILLHLKKGDEALFFGIDDDFLITTDPLIKPRLEQYIAKIVRNGISERLIVKEGNKVLSQAKTTHYRFLPEEIIGNLAFITYADRLAILVWGEPNRLIFIHNKLVATSYRNQFEILWASAKEKKNKSHQ